MGFDTEVRSYPCGCYSEYKSHDFFNYTKDHNFVNACGKHESQNEALEDQRKQENISEMKSLIDQARDVLVKQMDSDKVIHHLRTKNVLSRKEEEALLEITSKRSRAQQLLNHICKSEKECLQQFRIALIKSGHTDLLKMLKNDKKEKTQNTDAQLFQSYDGRCMLHLQYGCYVVAKEFNNDIYIHIRNYQQKNSGQYPTKKGVALTLSRWLVLEKIKDEVNELFLSGLEGKLTSDEEKYHLGGGIFVTVSKKFPTVDIRHFWKVGDADVPVATKKGMALNKLMWERLCYVMEIIRDIVPELDQAVICSETHNNEIELAACEECTPFTQIEDEVDYGVMSQNQEGDFQIMSAVLIPDTE